MNQLALPLAKSSVLHYGTQNTVLTTEQRVPHISLVFREMWDTTALSPDCA
jgi:hypothetical protein